MLSMTQLAPLFRREKDPPTALGLALLLILLKNPYAIASISLQLSFSAVAGLVWLTPKMTGAIHTGSRLLRFVAHIVRDDARGAGVLHAAWGILFRLLLRRFTFE